MVAEHCWSLNALLRLCNNTGTDQLHQNNQYTRQVSGLSNGNKELRNAFIYGPDSLPSKETQRELQRASAPSNFDVLYWRNRKWLLEPLEFSRIIRNVYVHLTRATSEAARLFKRKFVLIEQSCSLLTKYFNFFWADTRLTRKVDCESGEC